MRLSFSTECEEGRALRIEFIERLLERFILESELIELRLKLLPDEATSKRDKEEAEHNNEEALTLGEAVKTFD